LSVPVRDNYELVDLQHDLPLNRSVGEECQCTVEFAPAYFDVNVGSQDVAMNKTGKVSEVPTGRVRREVVEDREGLQSPRATEVEAPNVRKDGRLVRAITEDDKSAFNVKHGREASQRVPASRFKNQVEDGPKLGQVDNDLIGTEVLQSRGALGPPNDCGHVRTAEVR
jgi:hypothetical protein